MGALTGWALKDYPKKLAVHLEGNHSIVLRKTLERIQVGPAVDNIRLVLHGTDIAALRVEATGLDREHARRCLWDTNDLNTTAAAEVVVVKLSRIAQVWVGSGYTCVWSMRILEDSENITNPW